MPQDSPAFAFYSAEGVTLAPTPAYIRSRFQTLLKNIGLPTTQFNTHSLRRSGACYLLSNETPLEVIKVLGDWKSDSVFDYLYYGLPYVNAIRTCSYVCMRLC